MIEDIFHIKSETDFQQKCLETFRYQYQNIEAVSYTHLDVYKRQQLAYLKLHETENSYGEWFAEEN